MPREPADHQRVRPARPPRRQGRPRLVADDERHFAAIAQSLEQTIADLSARLDAARRAPGGTGQAALDRDQEIHRLTARLRALRRFGLDLCLGHMVGADDPSPSTSGGSASPTRRAAACWSTGARRRPSRSSARPTPTRWAWPAAAATAGPGGRVSDYWDEVFTTEGLDGHAAPRRPVGVHRQPRRSRSRRMRDVLGTIAADQDAIIRAGLARHAGRRRRPGHRQDRRRPAPHRLPALLRPSPRPPPRRGALRRAAPALPRLRRRRAAQPRRGGRADLHAA